MKGKIKVSGSFKKKVKIETRNLSQENIKLKNKLKELGESHKTIVTTLVEIFSGVLDENSKEIKLLKEGKAKVEAELILRELKKFVKSKEVVK